ncbi:MAG: M48 family metallopeptidase [Bacilli bacterium]|nr:M48 family metallopeptidase [Bacilli bacterium]
MKEILLNDTLIRYQITYKKDNKNTYFHFKPEGYIQINAAKKQSHANILAFIQVNKDTFIRKYQKAFVVKKAKTTYQLFSKKYEIIKDGNVKNIQFDEEKGQVIEPFISQDLLDKQYKKIEKNALYKQLELLQVKYENNGLVDFSKITFKTRYTSTRFGSCNPKKQTINFNLHLANFEEKYLEYVFLHEICHLVHFNHSKEFYQLLMKFSPNYKTLKRELNNQFKR